MADILIVEANPVEMEKFVTAHRLTFIGVDDAKNNLHKAALIDFKSKIFG